MSGIDTAIAQAFDAALDRWRSRRWCRAAQRRYDAQKRLRDAEHAGARTLAQLGQARLDRIDAEVAGFAREIDQWEAARGTW